MTKVVLLNGRSKSGTHLLQMGEMLGNACFAPHRDGWQVLLDKKERKRLFNNDMFFLSGHYQWTRASEKLLRSLNAKMVLIIRDLRDVLTSFYRAMKIRNLSAEFWQPVLTAYNSYGSGNQQEQIFEDMLLDKFGKGGTAPKHFMHTYFPWMEVDFCYVTRFEKLIGSRGGGDDLIQKKELQRIYEFIELPQTDEWYRTHALKLYNENSLIFSPGGGVGAYRRYFSKKNIDTFERVAGEVHRAMGYK